MRSISFCCFDYIRHFFDNSSKTARVSLKKIFALKFHFFRKSTFFRKSPFAQRDTPPRAASFHFGRFPFHFGRFPFQGDHIVYRKSVAFRISNSTRIRTAKDHWRQWYKSLALGPPLRSFTMCLPRNFVLFVDLFAFQFPVVWHYWSFLAQIAVTKMLRNCQKWNGGELQTGRDVDAILHTSGFLLGRRYPSVFPNGPL